MALEDRVDDLETQFNTIEQALQTKVRTSSLGELEAQRDQTRAGFRDTVAEITDQFDKVKGQVSVLRSEAQRSRKPKTFTVSGGATSYKVLHELGYKPIVQVLGPTDVVVSTVTVTHDSDSQFTLTAPSSAFTGTALYI